MCFRWICENYHLTVQIFLSAILTASIGICFYRVVEMPKNYGSAYYNSVYYDVIYCNISYYNETVYTSLADGKLLDVVLWHHYNVSPIRGPIGKSTNNFVRLAIFDNRTEYMGLKLLREANYVTFCEKVFT